jgi:hypothetical protein
LVDEATNLNWYLLFTFCLYNLFVAFHLQAEFVKPGKACFGRTELSAYHRVIGAKCFVSNV